MEALPDSGSRLRAQCGADAESRMGRRNLQAAGLTTLSRVRYHRASRMRNFILLASVLVTGTTGCAAATRTESTAPSSSVLIPGLRYSALSEARTRVASRDPKV